MLNLAIVAEYLPLFLEGLLVTVRVVALSLAFGAVLAVPLAAVRVYRVPVLAPLARGYSYVLRGTPLLAQVYLLYYGLGQFEGVRASWAWAVLRDAERCLVLGFSLNAAAYLAEILRGALLAIPEGEIEAARAFGMTEAAVFRRITLPGALRRSIPPLSNEVIFLVHASVIASTLSVVDILGAGRELNATYYVVLEGFLMAAAFYVVLIGVLTLVFRKLEARYAAFLR